MTMQCRDLGMLSRLFRLGFRAGPSIVAAFAFTALAQASTTVGALPGKFSVTSTGAASYSIPFALPPGMNGVTPRLGLVYNSRGGNGLLGVGWSLSGLSAISRCPRTVVQDDVVRGVQFDSGDRFCLDGNRLRLKGGSYGSDGATYQTEIDHFAQITSIGSAGGGPAWFKVETPDGRTLEYGHGGGSAIAAANGAIRVWRLNRIEDPNNNYIAISYTTSGSIGVARPSSISYGGAGGVSVHTVSFDYETRPDIYTRYRAGTTLRETHRLKAVTVRYGTTEVRSYTLDYASSATPFARSRLVSVAECGPSICLPSTTFTWQTPSWAGADDGPPMQAATSLDVPVADEGRFREADLNGDGFIDLLYVHNGQWYAVGGGINGFNTANSSGRSASEPEYAHTLDYNGDGRADIIQPVNGEWQVLLSEAGAAGEFSEPVSTGISSASKMSARVTDFDGNGFDDLVHTDIYSGNWYVVLNRPGVGFDDTSTHIVFVPEEGTKFDNEPPPPDYKYDDWNRLRGSGSRASFNGDGRDDMLALAVITDEICTLSGCYSNNTYYWQLLVAEGDHYVKFGSIPCNFGIHDYPPKFLDVNGDGLTDLAWIAPPASDPGQTNVDAWHWYVWINNGTGFDGGTDIGSSIILRDNYYKARLADWNADGRTDLFWPDSRLYHGSEKWVSHGTANGLEPAKNMFLPDLSTARVGMGDVNGDGLSDAISVDNYANTLSLAFHQGPYPYLMTGIVDGLGNTYEIAYKPLTNGPYSKGVGATYPVRDFQSSLYVVASYGANDGVGGTYTRDYSYSGAKVSVAGRGFLGFASIEVYDSRNGETVDSTYKQRFPYTGWVKESVTTDGTTHHKIVNSYPNVDDSVDNHPAVYFPHLAQKIEKQYDLSGAVTRTITTALTYSTYGQPTKVEVTTEGGEKTFISTTETTYDSAASPWCKVLPTSISITRGGQTRTTSFVNDLSHCRVTSKTVAPGAPLALTTKYTYDSYGNPETVAVSGYKLSGRITTFDYGATPFPLTITNALNQVSHAGWDYALGVPASTTDVNGNVTVWDYDGLGRKESETRPDGSTTSWTYSGCDSECPSAGRYIISAVAKDSNRASGGASAVVYDAYGRVVQKRQQILGGKTSVIDIRYDAVGRKLTTSVPHFAGESAASVSWSYDDLGRITAVSEPTSAGTATTGYSYTGLNTTVTMPNGLTKWTQRNAIGQITQIKETSNDGTTAPTETTYTYTPFGELDTVTDTANNLTDPEYNDRGMKESISDPDMGHWEYRYNAAGQLIEQIDAKGQHIVQDYDALGRLISRVEPQPDGASGTTTWTYDSATNGTGLLAGVTSPTGFSKSLTYDNLSRPAAVTTLIDGSAYTVNKTYDGFSRLSTVTYPESAAVVPDSPPVARAGSDRTMLRPATVTLDGSGSSDPDGTALQYFWRQTGGPAVTLNDPQSPSITFSAPTPGYYTFELRVNDGLKNASDSVTITVVPPAPDYIDLPTLIHDDTYTVSWGYVAGVDRYELYEDTDDSVSGADRVYSGSDLSRSRTHGDGYYHYWVRTRENDVPSAWRPASHPVEVLQTPGRPVPPTVGPSPSTTGSYTVRWSKRDDGIDVDRYYVQEYVNSNSWHDFYTGSATSKTVSNKRNASYHYRVKACNLDGSGNMTCSNYSDVSATERVTRKPERPTSISVSPTVVDSFFDYTVSWGAPSGNVPASYYQLERRQNFGSYTNLGSVGNVRSKTYTAPKVLQNTDFSYQVRACNSYGCSDWRGTATVTVKDPFHASAQEPFETNGGAPRAVLLAGSGADRGGAGAHTSDHSAAPFTNEARYARAGGQAAIVPGPNLRYAPPVYQALLGRHITPVSYDTVLCSPTSCEPDPCDGIICEPDPCTGATICEPPPPPEDDPPPPPEPYRLKVEYHYDASGMLAKVTDGNGSVYWQALDTVQLSGVTPRGQYRGILLGNGVGTINAYDPYTGALMGRTSGIGQNTNVQSLTYNYDQIGNLTKRTNANTTLTENFTYDALNRLTDATVTANGTTTTSLEVTYDEIGNIKSKTGVGTYTYDAIQPHAVDSISGAINTSYDYDANGNVLTGHGKTYAWTAFNKPWRIDANGNESQFWYGPSRARYKQVATDAGGVTTTTLYIGGLMAVIAKEGAPVVYRHNIIVGGHAVAIYTNTSDLTQQIRYLHYDVQGSVNAVTDGSGTVVARMSFSAFGQRRDPQTWQAPEDLAAIQNDRDQTFRGYTGHEQLDSTGLIHMNGRVYDPVVGRFISADPIVQAPYFSQSLNRYSYVWNNPMTFTDPSGFMIVTGPGYDCEQTGPDEWTCTYTGGGGGGGGGGNPIDAELFYLITGGTGNGHHGRVGGQGPFVGGNASGRGTARTMASGQSPNSSSLKIDKKELAKTLGQILEAAKTGTGLLGKVFTAKSFAELAVSELGTTIKIGLRDIKVYRMFGIHQPHQQMSAVNWSLVDWKRYDTGGSPENVMANFFNAVMKEEDE